MIGLRQTIERGMKHRWLGPLFVILFCVLIALVCLHGIHDAHHGATEAGELCLGLIVMFAFLIVIRLCWQVTIVLAPALSGRAPPGARTFRLPVRWVALAAPVPLRR
jgi:hypothetical protein